MKNSFRKHRVRGPKGIYNSMFLEEWLKIFTTVSGRGAKTDITSHFLLSFSESPIESFTIMEGI